MQVLIVDDERFLLTSIIRGLQVDRPHWSVLTASEGGEAMRILKSEPVDILVTDIQMPGMDGMALLTQVRTDPGFSRLPLIFITARVDRASMRQGMEAGAHDYLTKPFTTEELIKAIESQLLRSEREASPMVNPVRERLLQVLTEREVEVLACIGKGMVTKSISQALNLSHFTVSAHRGNIMRKLDLHNAAALAALAVQADFT